MIYSPDEISGEGVESLLRLPAVIRMTGLKRSTIYKHVALNQFPQPMSLVDRAVAWRAAEIEHWTQNRPLARPIPRPRGQDAPPGGTPSGVRRSGSSTRPPSKVVKR